MVNLYHIDCMEFMADKPDKYYDLAIVDPPYGIGVSDINVGARDIKNKSCDGKKWDEQIPNDLYFKELRRVSKEQIIWGANYFNCFSGGMGAIIWYKENPLPTSSQCEIASYSRLSKVAFYKKTWTNYVNDKETDHPTEKPIKLYEWLLMKYAKPGDKILDTHGGSGSICIACHDLGFDLDWCELDAEYFEEAKKRFDIHKAQLRIFQ
jgi:site-specific DNA-methyltransferase (adenine-specific)